MYVEVTLPCFAKVTESALPGLVELSFVCSFLLQPPLFPRHPCCLWHSPHSFPGGTSTEDSGFQDGQTLFRTCEFRGKGEVGNSRVGEAVTMKNIMRKNQTSPSLLPSKIHLKLEVPLTIHQSFDFCVSGTRACNGQDFV